MVHVIIVNYRTPELVADCLHSLADYGWAGNLLSVTVVDNHSEDGSLDRLVEEVQRWGWSSRVNVLPLSSNGGFASGNNRAIEHLLNEGSPCKYVWLLNPDTIVKENACQTLFEFMENNPKAGICGSALEDEMGNTVPSAFRFHTVTSEFLNTACFSLFDSLLSRWVVAIPPAAHAHRADWVSGASLFIRREVLRQGLLDEGYFMYFEEVDFCLRAKRNGWQCWVVPDSRVMHLEGASSGFSKKTATVFPPCWFISRQRFFKKNYGTMYAVAADCAWFLGHFIWWIRTCLCHRGSERMRISASLFFRYSILRQKKRGDLPNRSVG